MHQVDWQLWLFWGFVVIIDGEGDDVTIAVAIVGIFDRCLPLGIDGIEQRLPDTATSARHAAKAVSLARRGELGPHWRCDLHSDGAEPFTSVPAMQATNSFPREDDEPSQQEPTDSQSHQT